MNQGISKKTKVLVKKQNGHHKTKEPWCLVIILLG